MSAAPYELTPQVRDLALLLVEFSAEDCSKGDCTQQAFFARHDLRDLGPRRTARAGGKVDIASRQFDSSSVDGLDGACMVTNGRVSGITVICYRDRDYGEPSTFDIYCELKGYLDKELGKPVSEEARAAVWTRGKNVLDLYCVNDQFDGVLAGVTFDGSEVDSSTFDAKPWSRVIILRD